MSTLSGPQQYSQHRQHVKYGLRVQRRVHGAGDVLPHHRSPHQRSLHRLCGGPVQTNPREHGVHGMHPAQLLACREHLVVCLHVLVGIRW